jgi:hypothetical protein
MLWRRMHLDHLEYESEASPANNSPSLGDSSLGPAKFEDRVDSHMLRFEFRIWTECRVN